MAENQSTSQAQRQPPQININLLPNGQISYQGALNKESAEILEKLLQQAEYYRAKAKESDTEKQQARHQIDSITMVFVFCFFTMIVFLTYQSVSAVTRTFNHSMNHEITLPSMSKNT